MVESTNDPSDRAAPPRPSARARIDLPGATADDVRPSAGVPATIAATITSYMFQAGGHDGDVSGRLRTLVELRAEGVITDADDEAKKAELLRRL